MRPLLFANAAAIVLAFGPATAVRLLALLGGPQIGVHDLLASAAIFAALAGLALPAAAIALPAGSSASVASHARQRRGSAPRLSVQIAAIVGLTLTYLAFAL
jgi:hypothetical protein